MLINLAALISPVSTSRLLLPPILGRCRCSPAASTTGRCVRQSIRYSSAWLGPRESCAPAALRRGNSAPMPALATLRNWHGPSSIPLRHLNLWRCQSRVGALAVNTAFCAVMPRALPTSRRKSTRAAFLSARNDALANIAIIAAGLVTAFVRRSAWPDLIVGLGIAFTNMDATREVWRAAHEEHRAAAS